jgi:hypothetical protein
MDKHISKAHEHQNHNKKINLKNFTDNSRKAAVLPRVLQKMKCGWKKNLIKIAYISSAVASSARNETAGTSIMTMSIIAG